MLKYLLSILAAVIRDCCLDVFRRWRQERGESPTLRKETYKIMYGTVMPSAQNVQSIYRALFFDMARSFPSQFASADLEYLCSRIENEGLQFAFTTLPKLGKAVERSLITEDILDVPQGWVLMKKKRLPVFLNHLFIQVFNEEGYPRFTYGDSPSEVVAKALFFIRQITMIFSKVDVPSTAEQEAEAIKGFKARTSHIPRFVRDERFREVIPRARNLLRRVFTGQCVHVHALRRFQKNPWGRHGPGAVAGKERGGKKWLPDNWPGIPVTLFDVNSRTRVPIRNKEKDQPSARVVTVPKDFRGPRVICIEPKENQFAQQGLMEILYELVHSNYLTRSAISFWDVEPSRKMCYNDNYSTIDLKDASDNISLELARLIFPKWIFSLVTRYRTRFVTWKGEKWRTTCLASMGNATCFPLETLVFWALARATMELVRDSLGQRLGSKLSMRLRVFGDDLIVPFWAYESVKQTLVSCGNVINDDKSCHVSLVRESCGEWVFAGYDVSIVRCRTTTCNNHRSWLAFGDYLTQFRDKSCPATESIMRDIRNVKYPPEKFRKRFNRGYQRSEVRVPQFVTTGERSELPGEASLYAYFVRNDVTPFLRGARERVKWRWMPACLIDT